MVQKVLRVVKNKMEYHKPHHGHFPIFYFLLRISLGCEIIIMFSTDYHSGDSRFMGHWELLTPGIAHFMLGAFFFAVKPYKRVYMNHRNGLISTLFGGLFSL